MKKTTVTLTFFLCSLTTFCQENLSELIHKLNGIWIAEDYYNSFELTQSSIKSKSAFDPNTPVGLRINSKEIRNGKINIGYSELHDHLLHPEVSKFTVFNSDTIYEQGSFELNLLKSDSLNYYSTSVIFYYSEECKSYLTWEISKDTTLILYRPKCNDLEEASFRYKRITSTFKANYEFPNPIYYYTRKKTLAGNYILTDSLNRVVSNNFFIDLNGKTKGYPVLSKKTFFFSTDIYCGPEVPEDFVLLCETENVEPDNCKVLIYKRINEKTIQLHSYNWVINDEEERLEVGKIIYKLTKK